MCLLIKQQIIALCRTAIQQITQDNATITYDKHCNILWSCLDVEVLIQGRKTNLKETLFQLFSLGIRLEEGAQQIYQGDLFHLGAHISRKRERDLKD